MPEFKAEASSNVGWARYDEATQVLEVDFKDKNGNKSSTYTYADYPADEWEKFRAAESKGRFFAYQIRPRFKGVKKV